MSRIKFCLVCLALLVARRIDAQTAATSGAPRKQARAERIPSGSIRLDGHLDEPVWQSAVAIADFTQKEPVEGAAPTDPMEIRFVYDETALYVGARMGRVESRAIQAPLGRRDTTDDQAENILIYLDTYLDRKTSVSFGVTAAGVRLDSSLPSDSESTVDLGFDPVWQARTSVTEEGWTAELWIPFSQLRFSRQDAQIWGLNVRRFRPTLDEEDYWVMVPRTDRVFTSRFGNLNGISGVDPTRRIELLPYVSGSATMTGNPAAGNPFDDGSRLGQRIGADFKMGFGPNLTLDGTVNPDFGQVEADPAEVNLSAFETRFTERRPFFTEGSRMLSNISNPTKIYYSRRIGARPTVQTTGQFVDYPEASTIIGAAKLTGRLPSRTSIGILTAVTGDETARTYTLGAPGITSTRVVPTTSFSLARVEQEFGRQQSTVSGIVSVVHRDMSPDDPLAAILARNAVTTGGDLRWRFKGGEYELTSGFAFTLVTGEPKAIERIQRTATHYFQRPDHDYFDFDPTRTSLTGFSTLGGTQFERTSGRHWIWRTALELDTPAFESNDFGTLNKADGMRWTTDVRWRETRPGQVFRNYAIGLDTQPEWNFGGDFQSGSTPGSIRPFLNLTWKNFWTSNFQWNYFPTAHDTTLTRGGPIMERRPGWNFVVNLGNRPTSQTRWTAAITILNGDDDRKTRRFGTSFAFRPGPRWQLSLDPLYEHLIESQQYITTVSGGRAETFNSRYVFAYIDRTTVSTRYRLGFTLRPDMNVDVYAEPFAASGRYYDFGELTAPRAAERITYGTAAGTSLVTQADGTRAVKVGDSTFNISTKDFNTLSFRSNVVLRWEWRPGSTLYLVWQQSKTETETLGTHVGVGDMFHSLTAPGNNFFVIKTSFWLPVK